MAEPPVVALNLAIGLRFLVPLALIFIPMIFGMIPGFMITEEKEGKIICSGRGCSDNRRISVKPDFVCLRK